MQIAGNKCRICAGKIVFGNEGKACVHCGTFVHVTCEPRVNCAACGELFHNYEPPKPDHSRDTILPRALRPAESGGAAIALATGLLFLLFAIVFSLVIFLRGNQR